MTLPPQVLLDSHRFPRFDGTIELRRFDRSLEAEVPWTHAIALAMAGEVEAVASKSERIRYLHRLLKPVDMRKFGGVLAGKGRFPMAGARYEETLDGCVCPTRQNIAAYRQQIENGFVYALCLLRKEGM